MIAAIGGVITFLIYNQAQPAAAGPVWLVISGKLYVWGLIVEAGQRNATCAATRQPLC